MEDQPMFPLESVLFPGQTLPLRIFEERYKKLVVDSLARSGVFGIVLIEKGREVGGGDVRSSIGCSAEIIDHQEFKDGTLALTVAGRNRIVIEQWLDDAPYPIATIRTWPDELQEVTQSRAEKSVDYFLSFLERAKMVGYTVPELSKDEIMVGLDDTELSFRLSALIPVGPFDNQMLLSASGPSQRLDLVDELVTGLIELLTDIED
jgi:Lon protease-like protein